MFLFISAKLHTFKVALGLINDWVFYFVSILVSPSNLSFSDFHVAYDANYVLPAGESHAVGAHLR